MKLIIRNQSFEVLPRSSHDADVVKKFLRTVTTFKRAKEHGQLKWVVKDLYAAHIVKSDSYQFNDGEMEAFIFHIKTYGYDMSKLDIVMDKFKVDELVDLEFINKFEARDEQQSFINVMSDKNIEKSLVEARTGYGKTFMAAKSISILQYRTIIYIRPTYIAKWKKDLKSYFLLDDSDIFEISGSESIHDLLALPKESVPPFIVCSNVTMREYFTAYTNSVSFGYSVTPNDFMKHLNIGLMVSDESHQFFHNLYMAVTLLNPPKLIGLSATLISKDAKMVKLYFSLFPDDTRLGLKFYKRFTHFHFVEYSFADLHAKSGDGAFGYNHNQFEKVVLRTNQNRDGYLEMIKHHVDKYYVDGGLEGDKLLIYAKGLDMISAIKTYIDRAYPELDVRTYVGGSDYDDVLSADIRVSHPDKSGAAVDIPQLTTVINTINLDSPSQYMQMSGRLREIPGRTVRFIQLFSTNIPKHKGYIMSNMKYILTIAESVTWDAYYKTI